MLKSALIYTCCVVKRLSVPNEDQSWWHTVTTEHTNENLDSCVLLVEVKCHGFPERSQLILVEKSQSKFGTTDVTSRNQSKSSSHRISHDRHSYDKLVRLTTTAALEPGKHIDVPTSCEIRTSVPSPFCSLLVVLTHVLIHVLILVFIFRL